MTDHSYYAGLVSKVYQKVNCNTMRSQISVDLSPQSLKKMWRPFHLFLSCPSLFIFFCLFKIYVLFCLVFLFCCFFCLVFVFLVFVLFCFCKCKRTVQIPCGFQTASVVLCVALWFLIILPLFFLLRLHKISPVDDGMRSPLPDSLHIFNASADAHCRHYPGPAKLLLSGVNLTPTVTLWPFTVHFTPPPALPLSQTSWRCFCMICMFLPHQGISPTVSCGDLIKNCILFLAILPVLLIAIVKRADKIGEWGPKIMQAWFNLAPPRASTAFNVC